MLEITSRYNQFNKHITNTTSSNMSVGNIYCLSLSIKCCLNQDGLTYNIGYFLKTTNSYQKY